MVESQPGFRFFVASSCFSTPGQSHCQREGRNNMLIYHPGRGSISSYGVFQVYYNFALLPGASASAVSWIGSVEAFMLCCTTIFAGPLVDRGFGRLMVLTGTLLVVFGFMILSLCKEFRQLMLAQGLCMGIGHGCLLITSIAIVPTYFSTKRSLAIGIAAAGSSVGGVVYSIMFNRLMDIHHLTFEWTTRVLGITALATLLLPCLLIRQRRTSTEAIKGKIIDLGSLRQLPFALFNLATFAGNIGPYIPFFYISTFGTSRAGLSSELSFYLLPILSAGSVVGRIVPAFLADLVGPLNVLSVCTLVAGLLGFCWTAFTPNSTIAGLIAWSILYGASSGAFVSLQPSTVVSITEDMNTVGARLGLNIFCAALGLLIGTPIAGSLLQEDSSWVGLQVFCGATLLLAGGLVVATRYPRLGVTAVAKAWEVNLLIHFSVVTSEFARAHDSWP